MTYYVYLIISKIKKKTISYVGYTKDIKKRLILHNSGKGAKFTRGRFWKLVYSKKYRSKTKAMREEYKLKKNLKLRKIIKSNA
tara:strand:+ start:727 stop:975 length:249 start_codon:yes stop_codon:yes gene_type:complete